MSIPAPQHATFHLLPGGPTGEWRRDLNRPPLGTLVGVLHRALVTRLCQKIEEAGGEVSRPSQLYVLRGLSSGSASVTELADRCEVTKQAISQILVFFEERKLVRRRPDPRDGRGKIVSLTKRGERALEIAVLAWGEVEREWAAMLGGQDEMHRVREAMFAFVLEFGDFRLGDQQPRMRPLW